MDGHLSDSCSRRVGELRHLSLSPRFWHYGSGACSIFLFQPLFCRHQTTFFATLSTSEICISLSAIPTLVEILAGFALAGALGVLLGVFVSFIALAKRTVYPLLVSSQMVPKVAIAPVLIIWFGTGLQAKVLIAFLIAFFPITISTMVGLDAVDPDMVKLFRSMGAGPLRTFMKLRLPTALPNIFAGLKIGMSLAVVGAVVAEFVAADQGLGYYLLYANGQLDSAGVFGALTLLTIIGVLLFYAVELIERLFVPGALIKESDPTKASM